MTCIVGVVEGGRVILGGDSAGVCGQSIMRMAPPKVFANGPYVIGYTSSFRMGQVLQYGFKPPLRHADVDPMAFMATAFVDALRECLKAAGFASKDKETESAGVFLVGIEGRLFRIERDYAVLEVACGYDACGCGEDIARGALHALNAQQPLKAGGAVSLVLRALEAAAFHSTGVVAPFHLEATRDRPPLTVAELPIECTRMIVCATCGNKRCPRARSDKFQCTGSNDVDQMPTLVPDATEAWREGSVHFRSAASP